MTPWSAWLPDLLPHVPGCPQPLAELELKRAAQVLMRKTRAWRIDELERPVIAGQASVSAVPSSPQHELVRVEAAWYDGRELVPSTHAEFWHDSDAMRIVGVPTHFSQLVPGYVTLHPVPVADAEIGIALRLAVAPSESAEGLPDNIAARFMDAILVGAKARLMLYPGQAWTNAELAIVYSQAFDGFAAADAADAARGFVRSHIASKIRWC